MLKRIIPLLIKWKIDILLILLLIALGAYAWRLFPQTVIRSDGFIHLLDYEQKRFWGQKYWMIGIEVGPSIVGAIIPKFFGPNVSYYLWFEVGVILLINVLFYITVRVITRSSLIAFIAALIASVSYFGIWGANGSCYCYFLERVINMPFMIISFLLIHLFLTSKKKFLYILSLLCYFLGIALGHIEIMMTPIFVLYPFSWCLFQFRRRSLWKGILISMPFALISVGISQAQKLTYGTWGWPEWTLTDFIFNQAKYDSFGVMGRHLIYWADYFHILPHLTSDNVLGWISSPPQATANIPLTIFIYIIVFILLYMRLPKFRALLVTCVVGVAGMIFLNAYIRLGELVSPGSNRYLYFPTFFLSIFWAIAIWHLMLNKKGVRILIGIMLVIAYYRVNVILLDNEVHRNLIWSRSTKAQFDQIIQRRNTLAPNTLVVATYPELWIQEAEFFTQTLGKNTVTYETDNTSYYNWTNHVSKYDHVFKIQYDQACDCVKETKIK